MDFDPGEPLDRWRCAAQLLDSIPKSDANYSQFAEMTVRLGYIAIAVDRESPLADMESSEARRLANDAGRYADAIESGRVRFTDIPRLDSRLVRRRVLESGIVQTEAMAGTAANDDLVNSAAMEQASFGLVVSGRLSQLGNRQHEERTAAQAVSYAARIRSGEVRTGSPTLDRELWVDAGRVPVAIALWREEGQSRTSAAPLQPVRAMSA